ncbi:hypothetical protein ACEOG1_003168 [Salmonella enterica]|nr:hypothetical protein [Salmonella enterica subsp. enterica serovar Manhattan]EDW9603343.1 hypothetical protein [Salmonella enterica subsp. enterica serovar Ohio]EEX0125772.1 hypothetical protein [Salmonella enterica]EJP1577904.1 hypothetical protein [Salmonella enterica subsp. enterica serovar Brandenburg]EFS1005400.1 hypothetical protein [Salmonella enterica]
MFYVDNNSGSPTMPALSPAQSNTPTWFTEGDKNKGISWIGQDWLNILQAELLNILSEAGIKPDKGKLDQLTLSIKAIITANACMQANNLKEIFDAGAQAQAAARGHLGLGRLATKDSLGPVDVNALAKDQNLNDVPDKAKARAALELGDVATRYIGTRPGTVAAGNDARIIGAVQKTGDVMTGKLTLPQTSGFGVNTDNALGGSSVTFGDNDTGIKQNGDGILDFYANGQLVARIAPGVLYALNAVRAGDGKKLEVSSRNNSTLNAGFSLWGDGNRPTVIELGDDLGWHLYSQRNPDGSIVFVVNGDITANTLRAGGATYQNNGDIYGSVWGNNWLSIWLNNQFAARDNNINARVTSDYVNQTFVRAVRLGPQAFSGALWRDYQLGGGNVVTGFHTDGDWEMEGNDDHVYYRPVQYLVNGTWVTAASV